MSPFWFDVLVNTALLLVGAFCGWWAHGDQEQHFSGPPVAVDVETTQLRTDGVDVWEERRELPPVFPANTGGVR